MPVQHAMQITQGARTARVAMLALSARLAIRFPLDPVSDPAPNQATARATRAESTVMQGFANSVQALQTAKQLSQVHLTKYAPPMVGTAIKRDAVLALLTQTAPAVPNAILAL